MTKTHCSVSTQTKQDGESITSITWRRTKKSFKQKVKTLTAETWSSSTCWMTAAPSSSSYKFTPEKTCKVRTEVTTSGSVKSSTCKSSSILRRQKWLTTSLKELRNSLKTAPRKYSTQKERTSLITIEDKTSTSITLALTTKATNTTHDAH